MSNLIDKAKKAILHHGTTGFEEAEEVNIYADEGDDVPIVQGFAVHVDELPEPVIFQGSGYTAVEDMARAYVAMRRIMPEMINRLGRQKEEIKRLQEERDQIRDIAGPETDTAQPPMAAIREVLEDIDG